MTDHGFVRASQLATHAAVAIAVPNASDRRLVLAVQRVEDIGIRDPIRLCMPGGKIEFGESMARAAARELLEETGLDLLPERLIWIGSVLVERRLAGDRIAVAVMLAPPRSDFGTSHEHGLNPRWHPLDDLCDERHERFAGPARLVRESMRSMGLIPA